MTKGVIIKVDSKKALAYIEKKDKEIKLGSNKGLNKASFHMQNEVKESIAGRRAEPTSVDTGRFLNSIEVQTTNDIGKIFTLIPYAKFLEFGTSKLHPRRHFTNSVFRNKQRIREIIKETINQSIK